MYRIFNAPSDLDYKPKAGEKIIIYKFTKNDLINKKTVQSDIKGIPSINLTYDFKNIKNIKIDLSSSSYSQAKRVNIDTYGHAIDHNDDFPSVKKCSYKTAKVERESKKIMHKEIDNHLEFFINNEKISYESLLEKNFSNEEDINLVIKLKKSSDKIKVGNYDNDSSRACKNITSRHGKVEFGLKDKSFPKIYNLNFKLITTQF